MPSKKPALKSDGNRQAAYSARNKVRLVKDAQEVLAEIGPSATIEQLAAHAEVSPTTIYKYFENKDRLFLEALSEMWHNWVSWSFAQTTATDDLEATIESMRRVFRLKQTHPQLAQVIHNTLRQFPDFIVDADEGTAKRVFGKFASAGKINGENFDQRFEIWTGIIYGLLEAIYVTEKFTTEEADVALGIGLSVWGITEAKAKKLMSQPIVVSLHAIK
jgi:AcrR family transcriptional regulator